MGHGLKLAKSLLMSSGKKPNVKRVQPIRVSDLCFGFFYIVIPFWSAEWSAELWVSRIIFCNQSDYANSRSIFGGRLLSDIDFLSIISDLSGPISICVHCSLFIAILKKSVLILIWDDRWSNINFSALFVPISNDKNSFFMFACYGFTSVLSDWIFSMFLLFLSSFS